MAQCERERRHDSYRPKGGPEGDQSHQMSNKTKIKECFCDAAMSVASNGTLLCLCHRYCLCLFK